MIEMGQFGIIELSNTLWNPDSTLFLDYIL